MSMKWNKLGKIFDPADHALANDCKEFAQSPQALVFDDFVRIYFSTRQTDINGKYLSHIAYADFKKDFSGVLSVSKDTVIPLGDLGCFDEHGIFPMNVFREGNRVLGYTCGLSRRVSVSIESSIGLAISTDDGRSFYRHGPGPIMSSSLHEPFLVCDPFVNRYNGEFHMWYCYGTKWEKEAEKDKAPSRVYKIGHAVSSDGINWDRDGQQIISDRLNEDECQALPTVLERDGKYHMYFCYRQAVDFRKNKDNGYRLGYAYSNDLMNWSRDDNAGGITLSKDGWDSEMMCYPHIFECEDKVYLLYNGNEFGRNGFGIAELVEE
jgi:predicted GH43/DUF377 family glycosyl hydrolase